MSQNTFLEKIRSLPDQTKNRIMIVVIALAVIIFGGLWLGNIAGNFGDIGKEDFIPDTGSGAALSQERRVAIESQETKGGKTYIYFKVTNSGNDILNFATAKTISTTLQVEGKKQTYAAEAVTDRQNGPFYSKILSSTTNYGVLVFPELNMESTATILFDEMHFEQNQDYIFKEEFEINLSELPPVGELRS